ncbi:MAG: hypothetical protein MJZ87_00105 [Bacteroidales bacterium]|nr:hypothetical protein [Bacteroidales bacterium]
MKHIKHTMVILLALCTLTLIVSGCHKEKITKWRCVPEEGLEIVLTIDHSSDMVTVETNPDPLRPTKPVRYVFRNGDIYILVDSKIYGCYYNYFDEFIIHPYLGFDIVFQTDTTMELEAYGFPEYDDLYTQIKNYKFTKIL